MTNEWYKLRLGSCFVLIFAFFICVFLRIIQLQILPSHQLESVSSRQFRQRVKKTNLRYPIFDRNYEELAVSVPAGSIYARPKLIRQKHRISKLLRNHLGGSPEKWSKKLSQNKSFVWIQRQVSAETAKKIATLKLSGIFVESESRRLYPNGSLAAHVLGFTDLDGKGISGAELKANVKLGNEEDTSLVYQDGKGNTAYIVKEATEAEDSVPGVALTIDRRIQSVLEEELSTALQATGAKSIMAIVMDPYTGEIFALGQNPTFDPNLSKSVPPNLFTNQLISSLYEPGSTIKPLLVAEALEDGRFNRYSLIDCGNGKMSLGKESISEAESDHKFGKITIEKMVQVSSNVGAAKLGLALGNDRVRGLFERFGLLNKTGLLLPGETTGSLRSESDWVPLLLATSSFGQGIAVTPLQMVAAYAPFANGGFLVRPKIFMSEVPSSLSEDRQARRVLSPKVAQWMTEILIGVTEGKESTGAKAKIPGLLVAGKTGTAQKYVAGKGYGSNKYFSSFIGYLPADKPQLLIGVMVDEPKEAYYASQVAAPLFRKIAERSLQLLDKNPKQFITKSTLLTQSGKNTEKVEKASAPIASNDGWTLPELKGLSMKEVFTILDPYEKELKINVKYLGTGYLEKQDPKAGTKIASGTEISLHFSSEK